MNRSKVLSVYSVLLMFFNGSPLFIGFYLGKEALKLGHTASDVPAEPTGEVPVNPTSGNMRGTTEGNTGCEDENGNVPAQNGEQLTEVVTDLPGTGDEVAPTVLAEGTDVNGVTGAEEGRGEDGRRVENEHGDDNTVEVLPEVKEENVDTKGTADNAETEPKMDVLGGTGVAGAAEQGDEVKGAKGPAEEVADVNPVSVQGEGDVEGSGGLDANTKVVENAEAGKQVTNEEQGRTTTSGNKNGLERSISSGNKIDYSWGVL